MPTGIPKNKGHYYVPYSSEGRDAFIELLLKEIEQLKNDNKPTQAEKLQKPKKKTGRPKKKP